MPTITVRRYDYGELKRRLNADDRILILSCNACARQSDGLGGEQGLTSLSDRLRADGFTVHHGEVLAVACSPKILSERLQDEQIRGLFEQADVIIPLSCQAGENRISEVLPRIPIIRVTKTLGKGVHTPESGARLTEADPDLGLDVDDPEGLSLEEAARRLGLHSGRF